MFQVSFITILLSGLWVRSSRGIGLGLSGWAAIQLLLVYMSNRWIDKSTYASPNWQLHHQSTYTSLCTNLCPTDYKPCHIGILAIMNWRLQRKRDIGRWVLMTSWVHLRRWTLMSSHYFLSQHHFKSSMCFRSRRRFEQDAFRIITIWRLTVDGLTSWSSTPMSVPNNCP